MYALLSNWYPLYCHFIPTSCREIILSMQLSNLGSIFVNTPYMLFVMKTNCKFWLGLGASTLSNVPICVKYEIHLRIGNSDIPGKCISAVSGITLPPTCELMYNYHMLR